MAKRKEEVIGEKIGLKIHPQKEGGKGS